MPHAVLACNPRSFMANYNRTVRLHFIQPVPRKLDRTLSSVTDTSQVADSCCVVCSHNRTQRMAWQCHSRGRVASLRC